jgi:phosphohistidine phosphatase
MELYLAQHGQAKTEQEDPARPLTDEGGVEVTKVARALAATGLRVGTIRHSGKLRARQTADILADALRPDRGVAQLEGLSPNDDPALVRAVVEAEPGPLMLVGHLPHLSRLTSLLLVDSSERAIVTFRMGGVVCLGRGDDRSWTVRWVLTPDLLP